MGRGFLGILKHGENSGSRQKQICRFKAHSFHNYVTLGILLSLSIPQQGHLQSGDYNRNYPIRLDNTYEVLRIMLGVLNDL